jgi:hypothetical protein
MVESYKQGYESNNFELSLSTLGGNPLIIVLNKIPTLEPEPVFIVSSKSKNVIPSEPLPNGDSIIDTDNNDKPFNEVEETGRYYIIFASTKTYKSAYRVWEEWRKKLPEIEILQNEELGVFRVGIYAGGNHDEAMKSYRKARQSQSDAWILRPDMQ